MIVNIHIVHCLFRSRLVQITQRLVLWSHLSHAAILLSDQSTCLPLLQLVFTSDNLNVETIIPGFEMVSFTQQLSLRLDALLQRCLDLGQLFSKAFCGPEF